MQKASLESGCTLHEVIDKYMPMEQPTKLSERHRTHFIYNCRITFVWLTYLKEPSELVAFCL